MILLVQKITNKVKYAFEDGTTIDVQDNKIVTPNFVIGDLNAKNAQIVNVADVDVPKDFMGDKYIYHNAAFTKNKLFVDPTIM